MDILLIILTLTWISVWILVSAFVTTSGGKEGQKIVQIEAFGNDCDWTMPDQHHHDWPISLPMFWLPELAILNMHFCRWPFKFLFKVVLHIHLMINRKTAVLRGVKQLSRAGIQCRTIPVITFPISWYKICVRTGVETWKQNFSMRYLWLLFQSHGTKSV